MIEPSDEVDCLSLPDPGPCMAYIERYFYNTTSMMCEMFIYGGCKGNSNNYMTSEECMKACGSGSYYY